MDDSLNSSASFRRRLALGSGALLTLASLLPLSAAASSAASASSTAGTVTKTTTALTGKRVSPGDYVSSGWAISMPGRHPAVSLSLTKIVATIPLQCTGESKHAQPLKLVLAAPDASLTIAANDTAWHPTASGADAKGYESKALVGHLCGDGSLTPHGNATYTAQLVSSDTKDKFAIRFHSVDARTEHGKEREREASSPTDCTSTAQNRNGVSQCSAAWTSPTTSLAAARAPVPSGTGSGGTGGGGQGTTDTPGGGHQQPGTVTGVVDGVTGIVNGVTGKVTGTVAGHVGAHVRPLPIIGHVLTQHTTSAGSRAGTSTTARQPGGASAAAGQSVPLLILPAPSQSAVLGPVPLPVPVIDSVAAGVGGALPWKWFLLLAILDIGLIVGIVLRRRAAHRDRLKAQ